MEDLTLVGVHEDGEYLLLRGSGEKGFRIRIDDELRAAVRRDRARLGQLQIEASGVLRPREIQSRIRAGQTAEEVATAAGLPIEHVRRYEGPVLAEREFVATQARGVRMRRPGTPGSAVLTLGELVTQRLSHREVDEQATEWDAWRDDDGSWVVCLTFTGGTKRRAAHWTYDASLRHVLPRDDEARWFTDDDPPEAGPLSQRRLAHLQHRDGVSDRVYDVEADGAVRPADGRASVDGRPGEVRRATVDLLDTLRERRGRRQRLPMPGEDDADLLRDDELDSAVENLRTRAEALGNPPPAHPPRSRPELATDAEILELPDDDVIELPDDAIIELPEDEDRPKRSSARPRATTVPASPPSPAPAPTAPAPARTTPKRTASGRQPAARQTPAPESGSRPSPSRQAEPRQAASRQAASRQAEPRQGGSRQAESRQGPPANGSRAAQPAPAAARRPAGSREDAELGPDAEPPVDRAAARRSRRPSVPSWDDIVFGSRRE